MTFAALLVVIAAFIFGLKLAATFDIRRPLAHRNFLRDTTPPHDFTRDDGTKGRWP